MKILRSKAGVENVITKDIASAYTLQEVLGGKKPSMHILFPDLSYSCQTP